MMVAAFRTDSDHMEHPLQMQVHTGTVDTSGMNVLAADDTSLQIWNLDAKGKSYELAIDAKSSVKPAQRNSKFDCDAIPDQKADSYELVPKIQDLATRTGITDTTINSALLWNRVTLDGLDYRIDRASSCWDVKLNGLTHHVQRVSAGVGGFEVYYNNVDTDTFDIKVTLDGVVKYVRVKPVEIAGRREAVIWFGRFPHCPTAEECKPLPAQSKNPEFERFFRLLNGSLPAGKAYPEIYKISSGQSSPVMKTP